MNKQQKAVDVSYAYELNKCLTDGWLVVHVAGRPAGVEAGTFLVVLEREIPTDALPYR